MNELISSTFSEVYRGLSIQEVVCITGSQVPANKYGEIEFDGDVDIGRESDCTHIDIGRDRASHLEVHSLNYNVKTLCATYQSFSKYKSLYVYAIFLYGDRIDEG